MSISCIACEALSLLNSFVARLTAVFACGVPYLVSRAIESQDRIGEVLCGMPRSVMQVQECEHLSATDFAVPSDADRALTLRGSPVVVEISVGELRDLGKHPEFAFLSDPGYRGSPDTQQWPILGVVSEVEVDLATGGFVVATCSFPEQSISDTIIFDITELEFLALRAGAVENQRAHGDSVREASRQEEAALQDAAAESAAQDAAADAAARREAADAGVANAEQVVATRTSRRTSAAAARGGLAPLAQAPAYNAAAAEQCELCLRPRAQCSSLEKKRCCKRLVCKVCSDAGYKKRRGDPDYAAFVPCCEK